MHTAVIATLPSTASRAYTLTAGGSDMNVNGQSGAAYLVDIDSISVTEVAPGQNSSMSFTIWDPGLEVTIPEMGVVEFWDVTNTMPDFAGFVQAASPSPAAVGRYIKVECIGAEAVLDWMIVPSATFPSGMDIQAAIQSATTLATGIGVSLRAFAASTANGNQATPIGNLTFPKLPSQVTLSDDVTVDGDTLRETIRKLLDVAQAQTGLSYGSGNVYGIFTVDFTWGLRVYKLGIGSSFRPSDYDFLTLSDALGSQGYTDLQYETNGLNTPRGVYVKGGNAAGTGLVSAGSGLPGPIAYLPDDTITTATAMQLAGIAYLERNTQTSATGTVRVSAFAPTTNVRAGSHVALTSTQVGLSTTTFSISSIRKSYYAALQDWTIEFGTVRQRVTRQVRKYTRATRS